MSNEQPSDGFLLAAAARGDDAAFGILVRRHIRAATLLAFQWLGDMDDAEDVVQRAFLVVHQRARDFDPARPFPPWLFAIVRRLASNVRAGAARRARLTRWWRGPAPGEGARPEDAVLARIEAESARRAAEQLSPMQRACFELVVLKDLTPAEVAAMHGISEATVRQHVFRARQALRGLLGVDE